MSKKNTIELKVTPGIFIGLSKQNMLFHQVICELIDNSIASKRSNKQFEIEIFIDDLKNNLLGVWICDSGKGMSYDKLIEALQLGSQPEAESDRLHEHGFGLKNSLATATKGNLPWKIWTKKDNIISYVEGPFAPTMEIDSDSEFPERFKDIGFSTIVYFECNTAFFQTLQGRGRPTEQISILKKWLIEHLSVTYRYYLSQDTNTYEYDGSIRVDGERVPPLDLRKIMIGTKFESFEVELSSDGRRYKCEFMYGSIDPGYLVQQKKFLHYYQGNQKTQGIDIVINKRVIATSQFENIFFTSDGKQISKHNDFNDYIGELRILDVPRGVLTTVNNKTDFNLDDEDWNRILTEVRKFPPIRNVKSATEKYYRDKWAGMLRSTGTPSDIVTTEKKVWATGERIDVYRFNGQTTIYELKAGTACLDDVYQLMKYWDGLLLTSETPSEGVLIAKDWPSTLQECVTRINSGDKETITGSRYNIKLESLSDKNLI